MKRSGLFTSHFTRVLLRRSRLRHWYCPGNSPLCLSPNVIQAMAASANPMLADKGQRDPTLICTGYRKPRFYMFTRSEPEWVIIVYINVPFHLEFVIGTKNLAIAMSSTSDQQGKSKLWQPQAILVMDLLISPTPRQFTQR